MIRTTTLILAMTATPVLAIDSCMVGVWEADGTDMAAVMAQQMNGSATHTGGRATLEITETGTMTLLSEDMTFNVQVPNAPAIVVTVTGYAQGAMNADDGSTYVANAPEYSLVGSADVLGQRMEIPVTSATGGWGTSQGTYGCRADSMSFDATQIGSIPRAWRRIR